MRPTAQRIVKETLPTLALGAAGAGLFWLIGFPAYMLTGPAAAVSVATMLGLKSLIPLPLRDVVFVVIGVSIGSTVTPEVIETALTWPISLAILAVTLVVLIFALRAILMRGFGYDVMTATLAATPGHLSYVLGLSTSMGVDVARVALVQATRVLLLTLCVPLLISLWGMTGTAYVVDHGAISLLAAAVVFAAALALGLIFKRISIPAPLLLGAMAASAIGHGANLTPGNLPIWLTSLAFMVMGCLIGTRFRGLDRKGLFGALAAGAVGTLVSCAVAALGAIIAAELIGLPPAALLLAFAPGGVEIMAALAVSTGLEPALVAAHHVARLLILSVAVPLLIVRMKP
ncbi:MAG: AbrB family transcriptional regulator [Rhodobacteraceae bacterium]|nr:AbrB family transcriptional regulator [Paracoccaceae bacterium]QPI84467.1 AbrB family transcriptional regulator [Rhodobacterales bacterium HKCCA1288]